MWTNHKSNVKGNIINVKSKLAGINLIRKWVLLIFRKLKEQAFWWRCQITLPKQELIELNTQITANRLMTNGIDPNDLQNANQVENALNQINKLVEKANPSTKN